MSSLHVAYFSGEEQSDQIVDRHERIKSNEQNGEMEIFHANHLEDIILTAET